MMFKQMFKRKPIGLLLTLSAFALHAPAGAASNPEESPLRFSGFGTLGAVHNQGDGAAFIRDITQPKGATNRGISFDLDSRVGVQANYPISDSVEAVAQIVSRYRQENDYRPELTWGFLKYTFNDMLEMRAGRIGFDAYIGADSRDVGYSYLWVRPPVEYYGTLLFPYEDGGDIVLRGPVLSGVGRAKFYTGITRQQAGSLLEQREWAGNMTVDPIGSTQDMNKSRVTGGFVEYQDNHWIGRLGVAELKLARGFPPGKINMMGVFQASADQAYAQNNLALGNALTSFIDEIQLLNRKTVFKSIELAYEDGPLKVQGAVARITSTSLLIPKSRSAFVSAGYRFGRLTPYATASFLRTRTYSRPEELASLGAPSYVVSMTQFLLSTPITNQDTYAFGLRYELANKAAVKFQADFVHNKNCSPVSLPVVGPGTPCAPPLLWPTVPPSWDGRANIYSAVLDFTF